MINIRLCYAVVVDFFSDSVVIEEYYQLFDEYAVTNETIAELAKPQ